MASATPAMHTLERAGIAYTLHEYQYDPSATNIGIHAAKSLGILPARLLKTLMAKTDDKIVCALVPSNREMNLKKLASAAEAKAAAMLPQADAERATGYHVGGISPFGQRKTVPVYICKTALVYPTIFVNGGRRGLQMELAVKDLVRVLSAVSADLA